MTKEGSFGRPLAVLVPQKDNRYLWGYGVCWGWVVLGIVHGDINTCAC